ncbi:hypothetical protein DK853_28335, partial [Klebsiella oxytoca]
QIILDNIVQTIWVSFNEQQHNLNTLNCNTPINCIYTFYKWSYIIMNSISPTFPQVYLLPFKINLLESIFILGFIALALFNITLITYFILNQMFRLLTF